MMNSEKNKINDLRKQGFGYKKIAKELDLTIGAVRYACNSICDEDLLLGICQNCGLKIKSIKGKKKKKFCSDQCRWQWWNKHQKEVNKKAYYTQNCKWCNKEFKVYGNSKRLYCCHECYIKKKLKKGGKHDGTF